MCFNVPFQHDMRYSGKNLSVSNGYEEDERILKTDSLKNQNYGEPLPPPPPPPKKNYPDLKEKQGSPVVRKEEEDIFVGDGVDYTIPSKDMSQSPVSEDMEESPRNKEKHSYFAEPAYGPVPPAELSHDWQQTVSACYIYLYTQIFCTLSFLVI